MSSTSATSPTARISVCAAHAVSESCRLRLPFRFGMVTLERVSLCTLRLDAECDGERVSGYASDLMVPKWFEKNPDLSLDEDEANLWSSVRSAVDGAIDEGPATAFSLWRALYRRQVEPVERERRLVAGFGVALVERALLDALGRRRGAPLRDVLRSGATGFEPGELHRELAAWDGAQALGARVPQQMRVRHTVGLADELESPAQNDPGDGFPVTLQDDIRRYGLSLFKVKVNGDRRQDVERLEHIAHVLEAETSGSYELTLDGNEQYEDLGSLRATLDDVTRSAQGRALVDRILYIEQPLARAHSFDRERLAEIERLRVVGDLILDEADASIDSFREAVVLGYRGVSVKNCKGVFRAFTNYGLCQKTEGLFQSSEDLTNVPVLPLQQDLVTAAMVGLGHSERNGHHYLRGMDHAPASERDACLREHPDLYEPAHGTVALKIRKGHVELGSTLGAVGFGASVLPDLEARAASPRCSDTFVRGAS